MRRAIVLVALLVAGCASGSQGQEQALTTACATYAQALFALSGYRAAGKLDAGTIGIVDSANEIVAPICSSPTPPADLTAALATVESDLAQLQAIKQGVK